MRDNDTYYQSPNSNHISDLIAPTESQFSFTDETAISAEQQTSQKTTPAQSFNEAIIKLLVLLYQIDGKVTLTEQDYFDEVTASLEWRSGVSISAFINDAIHQARVAIDEQSSREFLFTLGDSLNLNAAQALEYAMDITAVDGNRSDDELELLSLLSNRVLARGLVV